MPITFRAGGATGDDGPRHSLRYRRYLASPAWEALRARLITQAGARCDACGAAGALELHHLTYARLGRERDADLRVLCHPCHVAADRMRPKRTGRG